MSTTAEQIRAWQGPAILTYGFRPFFFCASVWATFAMALWVPTLSGHLTLPTAFDPISWHAHEFLFGYLGAVMAGFLLTAVPNWTGRLPIVGWQLGALAGLWLSGRLVVMISAHLPTGLVAAIDLAFPIVLSFAIAREIVAGRNWRNLVVLALLAIFALANSLFHFENWQGDFAAHGTGLRMGLGAGILMIAVVGGRIVPSFTRNWLVKRRRGRLPAPPMMRFDQVALVVLLMAVSLWITAPEHKVTGLALLMAGLLHLVRLARWAGYRTLSEPLITVLHGGYAFLPLGALAIGLEILLPGLFGTAAAQHLWMAGALGLMTLSVMSRATLGHTGQPLAAGAGTVMIYGAVTLSVFSRAAAGVLPAHDAYLHAISGIFWMAAFGGFAILYGKLLLTPLVRNNT